MLFFGIIDEFFHNSVGLSHSPLDFDIKKQQQKNSEKNIKP